MRGVPARPVTGTSPTGHRDSRLDHASSLANRNATTAAFEDGSAGDLAGIHPQGNPAGSRCSR
jgi:hypothetical protein